MFMCMCVRLKHVLVTVPPIKVRRVTTPCGVLEYSTNCAVCFSERLQQNPHRRGKHECFCLIFCFFCPRFLLRCLDSFLSPEGFSCPSPSSTVLTSKFDTVPYFFFASAATSMPSFVTTGSHGCFGIESYVMYACVLDV